jgi:hypothetical protein
MKNEEVDMTLADLICSLRQRMLNAWEQNDKEILEALFMTFGILREASYEGENREFTGILVDLEDVTRDALMGFKFPAGHNISPISEEIRLVCSQGSSGHNV